MIKVTCYGQTETWESRESAMQFYLDGVRSCEGAERERYMNVYLDLLDGKTVCSDERNW